MQGIQVAHVQKGSPMAKEREIPGWLPISAACAQYGHDYEFLRRLVKEGIFTRGRFTSAKETAPIYLRVDELDAWKAGGVEEVERVRAARAELAAVTGPELGVSEAG